MAPAVVVFVLPDKPEFSEGTRVLPQSFSQAILLVKMPRFAPGRNYKLLPALAKNVPQAHFLNASRPPGGSRGVVLTSAFIVLN